MKLKYLMTGSLFVGTLSGIPIFANADSFTCPPATANFTLNSAPSGVGFYVSVAASDSDPSYKLPDSLGDWTTLPMTQPVSPPASFTVKFLNATSDSEWGVLCNYLILSSQYSQINVVLHPANKDKKSFKYPFSVSNNQITVTPLGGGN